jgi:hypothetical protein
MKIETAFEKSIHRSINGVIKVDQLDSDVVFQELDEYVLTQEVEDHFRKLIKSYNICLDGPTDKIGIWISGFFGSGKSHFIKMLSYLIQNIDIQGLKALEFFQEKIKDQLFLGDIERAVTSGTSDVILFNIDSKSDTRMHGCQDAIVQVFMKAFNEHLGYCAELPWLAELERQLEEKGQYDNFKDKYQEVTNTTWEQGRDSFHFDRDIIIKVLSETTNMSEDSAGKWFDKCEDNYSISVEKFAKILKEYCDKKGKNHRVIFLVDEVGQYIGDNRELMLNLQTIVEDLGTWLKGKAWVMVTSQEAIDSITKIKGEDFSKIRGRFATNISLSGDNTDEVIKKRLLVKNEIGAQHLRSYWSDISSTVKNLFTFSAGTAEMKTYQNRDDFVDMYPFVPYQFNLLQKVFEQVRKIGASGAHLSEGERSMLSAFQEAAISIADIETGELVPFHKFYGSIEAFLHGGIKRTVNQAKNNSNLEKDDYDLLKTLFMIKYIKEIRPNIENITTLSLSSINQDKHVLRNKIRKSLDRLVKETLVHKNGEEYVFLTNEEQDITRKIKSISIDQETVINDVGDIIFSQIYGDTRFKFNEDNTYGINKQIDKINKSSQGSELTLKVITIWCDDLGAGPGQMTLPQMDNTVVIKLPDDESYLNDIKEMKQIEKFISRKSSLSNSDTISKIIDDKGRVAIEIGKRVLNAIREAIVNAEFIVKGQREQIRSADPKTMINIAVKKLAENVYPHIDYVKEHCRTLDDIKNILKKDDLALFNEGARGLNKEAWREMVDFIQTQANRMMSVTVKGVMEKFSKSPYGWSEMDISGLLAGLYVQSRIRFRFQKEFIKDQKEIPGLLTNKKQIEKVMIEFKAKIDESILIKTKKIINEAFGTSNLPEGAEKLLKECIKLIEAEHKILTELSNKYEIQPLYPGKNIVNNGMALLEKLLKEQDEAKFFDQLNKNSDGLIDLTDDMRNVKSFFDNQMSIFNDALAAAKIFRDEHDYFDNSGKEQFEKMEKILLMEEPYNKIKDLPVMTHNLKDALNIKLNKLRLEMTDSINDLKINVNKEIDAVTLKFDVKKRIEKELSNLFEGLGYINECNKMDTYQLKIKRVKDIIFQLIDDGIEVDAVKDQTISGKIIDNNTVKISDKTDNDIKTADKTIDGKITAETKIYKKRTVKVCIQPYMNRKISNQAELDGVLKELRNKIEAHLESGCSVRIV